MKASQQPTPEPDLKGGLQIFQLSQPHASQVSDFEDLAAPIGFFDLSIRIRAGMAGGADLFVPSLMAFELGPGFHAGFVGVPPEGLGVRMATNWAI